MPTVVGVRLRFSKTLWFDPVSTEPQEGDRVMVETERGAEMGKVVQAPHDVEESALPAPLKPVLRIADEADLATAEELETKEREAMRVFRRLVEEQRLDMKPVDVEYVVGGDKIVFYFSADERIDFRELVRELASEFHARIDMRQVGVRDEARMVGGIGHCGQTLCCVRFGGEFQPVSIRMAKEQDLPLNPLKISGLCGRLMCCLRYEYDAYKDFKSRAPKRGAMIETPDGSAKVAELNTPRETVRIRLEDGTSITVPLAEMGCAKGSGCPCSVSRETMDSLMARSPLAPEAEPATERQVEPEPAKEQGRRRRRRKSGAGTETTGQARQAPPKRSEPKQGAPKQAGASKQAGSSKQAGAQPADKGGAAEQPRTGRRRRRRRPGGGNGPAAG